MRTAIAKTTPASCRTEGETCSPRSNSRSGSPPTLLFVLYGMAGVKKTFFPIPRLASMLAWPADVPVWVVRLVGVAEIAGEATEAAVKTE